jgi:hypothetical protein
MLAAMRRTGAGIVVPYSDNDTQGWEKIDLAYGSEVAATEAFATRLRMDRRGSGAFVHRAAASCLLLRREVLSKIGGFAPMFGFMVFADDDFLARAQIAGFKVFQAQDVFVHRLRNPEEVPDHLLRRNFDILMAKWLQNSDVDHKSREIPLSSMLGQAFHPQLHYEPLTLEELASQAEEIIETPSSIGVRFLVEPDWYEEGEEFEKVLRAFAALPVEPAASLLVRVDPLTVRYPERVIHDIASAVAGVQSEITPAHPVIIVNNFVSRVARGAVYRGADVFITTGKHGVRGLYEAEAKALGLVAIPADANLMRETLERWG